MPKRLVDASPSTYRRYGGRRTEEPALKRTAPAAVLAVALAFAFAGGPQPLPQAAATAATTNPSASPTATAAGLAWHACNRADLDDDTQCATLKVPLDYAHPEGTQISLALARERHKSAAKNFKGAILVNFGGPGASSLGGAGLRDSVPHGVGRDYDWIGWDPRGVGSSVPALHCGGDYFDASRPSYTPSTKHLLHYWRHKAHVMADECAKDEPELLNHVTTEDSARDMERIRLALGYTHISYYGFSYGTYLGQVYASLFGTHLKRLVLDSNVDPRRVWYGANLDQDVAFDANIRRLFTWIAKHHKAFHLGTTQKTVMHRYYHDLNTLARHRDGRLGAAEFTDAFQNAGYDSDNWAEVADDWSSYVRHGHKIGLLSDYEFADSPGDANGFAMYSATECTDNTWPTKWSRWAKDNKRYAAKFPYFTWSNAWFNAPCLYWHAAGHDPVPITGAKVKSALLIDETHDAATPYKGSLEVRKLFRHARLLAEPGGTSHADSLGGNTCVDNHIASYLKSGKLPKRRSGNRSDMTCKPFKPEL